MMWYIWNMHILWSDYHTLGDMHHLTQLPGVYVHVCDWVCMCAHLRYCLLANFKYTILYCEPQSPRHTWVLQHLPTSHNKLCTMSPTSPISPAPGPANDRSCLFLWGQLYLDSTQSLAFHVWFVLFSKMFSRLIHVAINGRSSFFLKAEWYVCVCICVYLKFCSTNPRGDSWLFL
jgi:hypothetical protein